MSAQSAQEFDLIIIGTGSGNSIPGPEFENKRIAMIEKGRFGGTCLNVGCIPTKMFVYAAEVAQTVRDAAKWNVDANFEQIQWQELQKRVFNDRIDRIAEGGEEYRRGPETPNITVFDQPAKFIGNHRILTGQGDVPVEITAPEIILAVGSRPRIPAVITESGIAYHTNEDIMRLPELPKSLLIYGGGYIAAEFAHIFAAFGVEVSLIARSELLLRHQDHDIAQRFTKLTEESAIHTYLGAEIIHASQDDTGVHVSLSDGREVSGAAILIATGRIPNGDQLGLDSTNVELVDGRIKVDEFGRTTAPGIWALGDCSSPYQLKHVANAEMRAVRHNLLHPHELQVMPHKHVPAAVFTQPQIASVGLTEEQAREENLDYTVATQQYGDVAYGWAMADSEHFAKLIANRKSGQLLGVHIIGPQAATLIQQCITAMVYELDMRDFARKQYWIHPALPELIENAVLNLEF
ncbi:MAG: mycothione reductase [Corynebacterium sp.]|nr:mycothione reductase [Corynebacterium sp.]